MREKLIMVETGEVTPELWVENGLAWKLRQDGKGNRATRPAAVGVTLYPSGYYGHLVRFDAEREKLAAPLRAKYQEAQKALDAAKKALYALYCDCDLTK